MDHDYKSGLLKETPSVAGLPKTAWRAQVTKHPRTTCKATKTSFVFVALHVQIHEFNSLFNPDNLIMNEIITVLT